MAEIGSSSTGSPGPLNLRPTPRQRADSVESDAPRAHGANDYNTGGVYRQAPAANVRVGKGPRAPDRRKFGYDVLEARTNPAGFYVTRDDRMSAVQAGVALANIQAKCGLRGEQPRVLDGFTRALFFYHTVNGGSTLNPGRGKFGVTGLTNEFDFGEIRNMLGVDARRFFRAFADDIRIVNQGVLDAYDPDNIESVEHYGWLIEVAAERGMTRFPDLAHDSADACTELNASQRQALMESKRLVLGNTVNSADRLKSTSRTLGLDGFDSTTGTKVV